MDEKLVEKRPDELKKPVLVNTFRTQFIDGKIVLELGNIESTTVDVISSVCFDPDMLYDFIVGLVQDGLHFQDKFNIEVFPENTIVKKENIGE